MEQKNFNMVISFITFIIGGLFILSDGGSITANLVGDSGSKYSFASFMGLMIAILSMTFFVVAVNLGNADSKVHRDTMLEKLARENDRDHRETSSEIARQDAEARYSNEHPKSTLDTKE